ncbi:50S ribosomal protein L21e [Candidatus Marsarchaeota G2 archaeon ECH_B_SAG-F08]|jgi:large subunit ribosomal protein L21e|uniref:Large ribosomal subunit protein eL21 n=4 Tax=Candidatus Marsarchaeota TaxID=1978152 RepID=A0A2R6AHW3_9ARCH|nr:MAG: 50S ribosomal protein L21e [Candidatus Marsarchaeota G1 archaeon OSP_D]PSN85962.1 MAG: 50S ribosomal protein L21e [Candidatus Marsarchaeota G1 archaeon BE_D]PSN88450.1 MAG: 50S ribosomal protein L21e [Candidatus Marsarchaeota G1 archaeon OSP_C]PSN98088.1 MAG: 50S ribosomal protein L21e [Candidatus Marsarchaeota G2 archaeon ECH_B_SAG-F08]
MTRAKGLRNRSRKLLTKRVREKGMPSVARMLKTFSIGEKVVIKIEPSVHKGMPHRRFQGKVGIVKEKRGRAYVVEVSVKPQPRLITVRPVHLLPFKEGK